MLNLNDDDEFVADLLSFVLIVWCLNSKHIMQSFYFIYSFFWNERRKTENLMKYNVRITRDREREKKKD